jgi:phosphoribosylanthranilate isomerase
MTFIKFCGMTRAEDVAAACELGVDAVGFVLWPKSPRHVQMRQLAPLIKMLPPTLTPVGVFVSPDDDDVRQAREAGVRVVQVHGDNGRRFEGEVWVARPLDTDVDTNLSTILPDVTIVLDAHDPERHGGTGRTIDWARAAAVAARRKVLLAGGLTPANVGNAIDQVRPFGVDVASGIEDRPGVKNAQAMKAFVAAVREAER